jgi:hypothetical protein
MRRSVIALAAAGLAALTGTAAAEPARAWIEQQRDAGGVTLRAYADLPGPGGRYALETRRTGAAGRAVTRQAGAVPEDGTGPLTVSRLSFAPGDRLEAELVVTTAAGEVLRDRLSIGE